MPLPNTLLTVRVNDLVAVYHTVIPIPVLWNMEALPYR